MGNYFKKNGGSFAELPIFRDLAAIVRWVEQQIVDGVIREAAPVQTLALRTNSYLSSPLAIWRTNKICIPEAANYMCFDALVVASLAMSMDDLGLIACPIVRDTCLPFPGISKLLKTGTLSTLFTLEKPPHLNKVSPPQTS